MNVETLGRELAARLALARPLVCLETYDDLPTSVGDVHDWLHPSDPNRIDADGKLMWCDGVATLAFGTQAGTSLADLATSDRGFLEWVLRKDFSDEVKAIVREALQGRFSTRGEVSPASEVTPTVAGARSLAIAIRTAERQSGPRASPAWRE